MLLYNQASPIVAPLPFTQTAHPIDAFNLRDPQYGLFAHLQH